MNMDKNERIDKVSEIFKRISEPGSYHYNQKFRYLPNWLDNTSYYYQKEATKRLPQKYYYFKRGTVIRVNFGTNLGSEFSNVHFAIVLDKKDSPKKRTLTVLPLTSKQKSDRFSLGREVFNQTVTLLRAQIKHIDSQIKIMKSRIKEANQSVQNLSQENYNQLKKSSDQLEKDLRALSKVLDIYKVYDKNSYVRVSDITTISKLRIERINKYDPSGKIRLSSQQMALISQELMKQYLNK